MKAVQKPQWLRRAFPLGSTFEKTRQILQKRNLRTVCQEARCPNQWECFSKNTATFLLLGSVCTRNCRFCSVAPGEPLAEDMLEPMKVAEAAKELGLKYVVLTSVTRDDLDDGGANVFVKTIQELKKRIKTIRIEVLIPDFNGDENALKAIVAAQPDVISHNMETILRLYSSIRPKASYHQSLYIIQKIKELNPKIVRKTGIMLGLGETRAEVIGLLQETHNASCQFLTIGQYLQPDPKAVPVERYIPPAEFEELKTIAQHIGFQQVASGPFVRSSYEAQALYAARKKIKKR